MNALATKWIRIKISKIASELGIILSNDDIDLIIRDICSDLMCNKTLTMSEFLESFDKNIPDKLLKYLDNENLKMETIKTNELNSMNMNFDSKNTNKRRINCVKAPKHICSLDVYEEIILKNMRMEQMHDILNRAEEIIKSLYDHCDDNSEDFDIIMDDLNTTMRDFVSEHSKYIDEEEIRSLLRSLDTSKTKTKENKCNICNDPSKTEESKSESIEECDKVTIPYEIAEIINIMSYYTSPAINEKIDEFFKNPRIRFR